MRGACLVVSTLLVLSGCQGGGHGNATRSSIAVAAVPGVHRFPADDRPKAPLPSTARTVDARHVDLRTGQVTVINIWATYCFPCQQETPRLVAIAEDPQFAKVQFLGVSRDLDNHLPSRFLADFHVPYPSTLDPDGDYQTALADFVPRVLPETIVLDRRGRLAATVLGPINTTQLRAMLIQLLAE